MLLRPTGSSLSIAPRTLFDSHINVAVNSEWRCLNDKGSPISQLQEILFAGQKSAPDFQNILEIMFGSSD